MITRLAPADPNPPLAFDDTGDPYINLFARALAYWVYCQAEPPSIEHAAMAWNATTDVIRQAVEASYWLFECDGRIKCDGE